MKSVKDLLRMIFGHKIPQLNSPDVIETKERNNNNKNKKKFAQSLKVSKKDMVQPTVIFKEVGSMKPIIIEQLLTKIDKIGGELGRTHNKVPTTSGKINGENFVSVKKECVDTGWDSQTICTENGCYDISKSRNGRYFTYIESLNLLDGTSSYLDANLRGRTVYHTLSKGNYTLKECAKLAMTHAEIEEFEKYAQPYELSLKEYAENTYLPIIVEPSKQKELAELNELEDEDISDLCMTMREDDERSTFPYIISIEVNRKSQSKTIKYAYTSIGAYKDGEYPYMIYMDGIDGRTGPSGMFRYTIEGYYIDNSTFREGGGSYNYDIISFEGIMKLVGEMPTHLSSKCDSVIKGNYRMPDGVEQIYNKAVSLEREKEGKQLGDPPQQ